MSQETVVLAYSGGLDTSVAIKWLQQHYQVEVVAFIADLGEGKDLQAIHDKALAMGAKKCIVQDCRQEFAEAYIKPALLTHALYEGQYPLISALSRPLIAKWLVRIAQAENASYVAHGCTGKGNDQVRFDVAVQSLAPHLKIIAPVREAALTRDAAIAFAEQHGIPLPIKADNPFSIDLNLWGRSCECGVLEDPWVEPPEAAYALTCALAETPDEPEYIELSFEQGVPVALNGQALPLHALVAALNVLAGTHGVGRIDHVENRLVGIKSREIYEAPAAMTLIQAHQALEALTLTRDVLHFKPIIEQQFAQQVYNGFWFSPLQQALVQFIQATQTTVTGKVKVKLYKGHAQVVGRQSAHSLYDFQLATYNEQDQFDHHAAEGFIKLWGLANQTYAKVNGQTNEV